MRDKEVHVFTEKGGMIAQGLPIAEARKIANKYARENIGQSAHIFGIVESHLCPEVPPTVTKGYWAQPQEE